MLYFTFPLTVNLPFPVLISSLQPDLPIIYPPVGKSGPFMIEYKSLFSLISFLIILMLASNNSNGLCGNILVDIPTAIPEAPLVIATGNAAGNTLGSFSVLSKLSIKSTALWLILFNNNSAPTACRASIYLSAAADAPSIDPLLPWISINGTDLNHDCDKLTAALEIEPLPCAWYASVKPDNLASFIYFAEESSLDKCVCHIILLCTGFKPSLASGIALSKMTDAE